MIRIILVVAAALLISLEKSAKAADAESPNADKLLATLNMVGINSKEVRDFVNETNSRIDNQHTMALAGDSALGGQWSLRYDVDALPSGRQFELRYAPTDSNVNVVARTSGVQLIYHVGF